MASAANRRLLRDGILAPGLTALACAWCLRRVVSADVDLEGMARGKFTAAAWPRFMLWAVIVCCGLQALRCLGQWVRGPAKPPAPTDEAAQPENLTSLAPLAAMPAEDEDPKIAACAGFLVIAYGLAFEWMGFLFSTVCFFAAWLLLGGFRKRLGMLVLVAILGTLFNVGLFVKVARMPLEKGKGVFDRLTVAAYRALWIY